jgi:ribosome-associated translation inhibitor RaiA
MSFSTYVTFKNLESSEALEARIVELANKLDPFAQIIRCDVAVEVPHRHHRQGRAFHVRILLHLGMHGQEIVVSHDPGDDDAHHDPYVTVRDAFDAARRQLQQFTERLRGEQKARDATVAP